MITKARLLIRCKNINNRTANVVKSRSFKTKQKPILECQLTWKLVNQQGDGWVKLTDPLNLQCMLKNEHILSKSFIYSAFLHVFCLCSHSCQCCIRQANLPLNPDRSVSHTHTHTWEMTCVCERERERNWPCLVKLNVEKRVEGWDDGRQGSEKLLSLMHTRKNTHTHTVSLASIEHQEINLLFPLIWWKRRDSLTLRRQFLSPNIPSLSPSLSLSLSCVLLSLPSFLPPLSRASLVTVKRPKEKGGKEGREPWRRTKTPLKLAKRRSCLCV